ncbi:unnamed protein product, partial [Ectocarpus sp. 12 AP-2014]
MSPKAVTKALRPHSLVTGIEVHRPRAERGHPNRPHRLPSVPTHSKTASLKGDQYVAYLRFPMISFSYANASTVVCRSTVVANICLTSTKNPHIYTDTNMQKRHFREHTTNGGQ